MIVLRFRTAAMVVTEPAITSCFADGSFNQMWLDQPTLHEEFAIAAGYGADWRRYITEHDAVHHLVADALGRPWSYALHDGNGETPLDEAPQRIKDEEHVVQRVQRLIMLGEPDPYDVVPRLFGERLSPLIRHWRNILDTIGGPIARPGLPL